MRDLSYSDALSGNSIVRPDGGGRSVVAQRLEVVRHGARRLSAQAHDRERVGHRLRVVLSAAVFPSLDIAPEAARRLGRTPLPGDVVSLQALESALALFDSQPIDWTRLASACGKQSAAAPAIPRPA